MRSTSRLYLLKYPILMSMPLRLREKLFPNGKCFIQQSKTFHLCRSAYTISCLLARIQGIPADQEVFDKHVADLSVKLEVYDKILSKQKYLAGDVRYFTSG